MPDRYVLQRVSEFSFKWLLDELDKIANSQSNILEIEFLTVAPAKPREGMTVGADGTSWNPGGGKGVYTYYSGSWNKLG